MESERERRIRERAYEIWEQNGREEGRSKEHWAQAVAEIDGKVSSSASSGKSETSSRRKAAPADASPGKAKTAKAAAPAESPATPPKAKSAKAKAKDDNPPKAPKAASAAPKGKKKA